MLGRVLEEPARDSQVAAPDCMLALLPDTPVRTALLVGSFLEFEMGRRASLREKSRGRLIFSLEKGSYSQHRLTLCHRIPSAKKNKHTDEGLANGEVTTLVFKTSEWKQEFHWWPWECFWLGGNLFTLVWNIGEILKAQSDFRTLLTTPRCAFYATDLFLHLGSWVCRLSTTKPSRNMKDVDWCHLKSTWKSTGIRWRWTRYNVNTIRKILRPSWRKSHALAFHDQSSPGIFVHNKLKESISKHPVL